MSQQQLIWVFVADGLLLWAISVPMITGHIPRNPWYGFRTPKTLQSDDIWYSANRYAGIQLGWAGLLMAGSSALLFLASGNSLDSLAWAGLSIVTLPMLVAVYRSFQYVETL